MADDVSPTTGEEYYSGGASNVRVMMQQLATETGEVTETGIDTGISIATINGHQEIVDRSIDDRLRHVVKVPLKKTYVGYGDSETQTFPGRIREIAILMTAARILTSEMYDVEPGRSESIQQYMESANLMMREFTTGISRIPGQKVRGSSRTKPPGFWDRRDEQEVGLT